MKTMNWRGIMALMRKDLKDIKRTKTAMFSMITLPLIMFIIAPVIILAVGYSMPDTDFEIAKYLQSSNIPEGVDGIPALIYIIFNAVYLPLFMIIPSMLGTITSSTSYCGEKEHRTLEGIMSTKLTSLELNLGKAIAAFIPSYVFSIATAFIYGLIIDIGGYSMFGRIIFPSNQWIMCIFISTPLITLFSILLMCFISQRARTVLTAQGLGMLVCLPICAFMSLAAIGNMTFKMQTLLTVTAFLIIADILGLIIVSYTTDSEEMLLKQ